MPTASGRTISTMIIRMIREINIATTLGLYDLAQEIRLALEAELAGFLGFLAHYTDAEYPLLRFAFSFCSVSLKVHRYAVLQDTWADPIVVRDFISLDENSTVFLYENVSTNLYFAAAEFYNKVKHETFVFSYCSSLLISINRQIDC
jgi:hypothetical protein